MKRFLHVLIILILIFSFGVNVYADDFDNATLAVGTAETTVVQTDVDSAQLLVSALADGTVKTDLQTRLTVIQAAMTAVLNAQTTVLQTDVDSAQLLVSALAVSILGKTILQVKLDVVQETINVTEAQTAVGTAETTVLQTDVDSAQLLVSALADGTDKTVLQNRLDVVQETINVTEAQTAVGNAETNQSQVNVDAAQILVTNLADGPVKIGLQARLDVVQEAINLVDATALKDEIENAAPGATIKLSMDINYDQSVLGSIIINKAVTLDCNEFKIKTDQELFQITSAGALTLVKAQIEAVGELIDTNRGYLTVQSTYGNGISSTDDVFVYYNYGTITIENGIFNVDEEFVYYNYGTLTIKDGEFTVDYAFVYDNYGTITIEDGIFSVNYDFVEDNYGTLTINDGEFNIHNCLVYENDGTVTIENGIFNVNFDFIYYNYGILIIKDGAYTGAYRIVAYTRDLSEIYISGGIFESVKKSL